MQKLKLNGKPREKGLWETGNMKKPSLRVTKWLGDIPVAGECRSCVGVAFDAKSASHRPSREEYQKSLQSQFDAHVKKVHVRPDANQTGQQRVSEDTKDE